MQHLLHYLSYWDSALAIVLVFGGLIFFHELGHFIAFRTFGVGVITFSVGMGPRAWGFKRGKTDYRISWLPIGGFVAGVGEYSQDVTDTYHFEVIDTHSLGYVLDESMRQRGDKDYLTYYDLLQRLNTYETTEDREFNASSASGAHSTSRYLR